MDTRSRQFDVLWPSESHHNHLLLKKTVERSCEPSLWRTLEGIERSLRRDCSQDQRQGWNTLHSSGSPTVSILHRNRHRPLWNSLRGVEKSEVMKIEMRWKKWKRMKMKRRDRWLVEAHDGVQRRGSGSQERVLLGNRSPLECWVFGDRRSTPDRFEALHRRCPFLDCSRYRTKPPSLLET